MQPGLLIKLRPTGPWRFGPPEGGHDSVDTLFRSDRLYSALTLAMQRLGFLDEWLDSTAKTSAKPALAFSSLFPSQGDVLFAIPPATLWPPPLALLHSPSPVFLTKIRWKTALFVPISVIDSLITGQPILADQWLPDPESGCLLRRDRPSSSPFRTVLRTMAPVDRLTRTGHESRQVACVEFEPGSGLWSAVRFAGESEEQVWSPRLQAAWRLLADSGLGGGRSIGWGQTQSIDFQSGVWPNLLLPKLGRFLRTAQPVSHAEEHAASSLFWLLSLYSPSSADQVDWSAGHYSLSVRGGRAETQTGSGALKKTVRMIGEGCVLASPEEPIGAAVDVAPDGFAHPIYRSGLALALELPVVPVQPLEKAAEPEAVEASAPTPTDLEIESEAAPQPTEEAPSHGDPAPVAPQALLAAPEPVAAIAPPPETTFLPAPESPAALLAPPSSEEKPE